MRVIVDYSATVAWRANVVEGSKAAPMISLGWIVRCYVIYVTAQNVRPMYYLAVEALSHEVFRR